MTTLSAWAPMLAAAGFQRTADRLFDSVFAGPTANGQNGKHRPPVDLYETPQEFVLRAWLPGIRPDDLDVTVDKGVLTVRAAFAAGEAPEGATWHRRELGDGAWTLSFHLPRELEAEQADASYENGVLTLRLPKAEAARPHTIQVRSTV